MKHTLSVVVIGLNEATNLERCFESVRHGCLETAAMLEATEILYVDSGSDDQSVSIARGYCNRIFQLTSNPSAAAARAVGLKHAASELVLFLDGDMELQASWLPTALSVIKASVGRHIVGVTGIRDDVVVDADTGKTIAQRKNVYRAKGTRRAQHIGGACLVRREAVESVGGYQPELRASEEPDLYARLLSRKFYILELPIPFIRHYTPATAAIKRLGRLLSVRGGSYSFGSSFWFAVRGGYLWGLARVYPYTFLVWAADSISLVVLVLSGYVPFFLAQAAILVGLTVLSRAKEFVTARTRLYGVALAARNQLCRKQKSYQPDHGAGFDYMEIH